MPSIYRGSSAGSLIWHARASQSLRAAFADDMNQVLRGWGQPAPVKNDIRVARCTKPGNASKAPLLGMSCKRKHLLHHYVLQAAPHIMAARQVDESAQLLTCVTTVPRARLLRPFATSTGSKHRNYSPYISVLDVTRSRHHVTLRSNYCTAGLRVLRHLPILCCRLPDHRLGVQSLRLTPQAPSAQPVRL